MSEYEVVLTCKVRCPNTYAGASTDFIAIRVDAANRPEAVAKVAKALNELVAQSDDCTKIAALRGTG